MRLDTSSLERIDSFPYRHKVAEVMSAPIAKASPQSSLVEAARMMAEKGISSILVTGEDGSILGIVTERDVLRAVAQTGSIGLHQPLSVAMSKPVATVREEAMVFVALGRMDRLKVRHLAVVDRQGRAVGMITARTLLKLRAGTVLALGDEIVSAPDAKALSQARAKVFTLAQSLMDEDVDAIGIANVVSTVLRDIAARAAELAEMAMAADGWGSPPAPGCLLVLGPAARGESLFGAVQCNAIVYDGGPEHDAWYAEISRRICDILEQAGLARNQGGAMCVNQGWRRSVQGWKEEIDRWTCRATESEVGNISIFADFRAVYGSLGLADPLRQHLLEQAAGSPNFLKLLESEAAKARPPVNLFGGFDTVEGRFDIKKSGLLRLVGLVRTLSLRHGFDSVQTRERLALLVAGGHVTESLAQSLLKLHNFMTGLLIRQQLADMRMGLAPGNLIDPKIMSRDERNMLKDGFKLLADVNPA